MNAHQLDADGVILNTIVVDDLEVLPSLVDASIGGSIGDKIVNGVLIPFSHPVMTGVPDSVDMLQARLALLNAGKLDLIQPAIDGIADAATKDRFNVYWSTSKKVYRHDDPTIQIGTAIGLSSNDMDALFIAASKL